MDMSIRDVYKRQEYRPRSEHRSGKKKKHHGSGRGLTIAALIGGAVLLIVLVVVLGRAAGLFGTGSSGAAEDVYKRQIHGQALLPLSMEKH